MKHGSLYCEACKQGISEQAAKTGPACPWCGVEAITRAGGEDLDELLEGDGGELLDEDLDEAPLEADGLDDVPPTELIPCDAPLLRPVGGIQAGRVVYVTGEPGAGKSTCCAEVAVALGVVPHYLDAEMPRDQCRDVFVRAGASLSFLRRVRRIPFDDRGWSVALELAEAEGAQLMIVDSLHEWAGEREADRKAFMREICAWAKRSGGIALVIAHWSRKGRASGESTAEHLGHCTIIVREQSVQILKCRWAFVRKSDLHPRARAAPKARKASPASERDRSPWEVLGVPEGAPIEACKAAFRERAAQCHPDKVQRMSSAIRAVAEAEFKAVNAAWKQLKGA